MYIEKQREREQYIIQAARMRNKPKPRGCVVASTK